MKRFFVAAACSVGLATSATALAAPAPTCTPASVTPQAKSIPANLPAFGYTALSATAGDVHLVAKSGAGGEIPLTLGRIVDNYLELKPSMPLTPGTSYELQYQSFCDYGGYPSGPVAFVAAPEAPLPTKLADVTAGPTVTLRANGQTEVDVTATYTIADEMKPWIGVYELGTSFDGKVIQTSPTIKGDTVQIQATTICDAASSTLSKHTFQLQGHLPFAPPVATVASTLEFTCPAPTEPPGDVVTPPGSSSGSSGTGDGNAPLRTHVNGCSAAAATGSGAFSAMASIGLFLGLALVARRRLSGASAAARRK
jgi:hypothetical protein